MKEKTNIPDYPGFDPTIHSYAGVMVGRDCYIAFMTEKESLPINGLSVGVIDEKSNNVIAFLHNDMTWKES